MKAVKHRNPRGTFKGVTIDGKYYHKTALTPRPPGTPRQRPQLVTTITQEVQAGGDRMTGATLLAWRRLDDHRFEVVVVHPDQLVEPEPEGETTP